MVNRSIHQPFKSTSVKIRVIHGKAFSSFLTTNACRGMKGRVIMNSQVVILDASPVYSELIVKLIGEISDNPTVIFDSCSAYVQEESELGPVSLFILDIELPGKADGIQALRRIRANPRYMATPIVIITSLDEGDAKGSAAGYDVLDYIIKPFKGERFRNTVAGLLQREDYSQRFSHAPEVRMTPVAFIERELRVAARSEASVALILVSTLSDNGNSSVDRQPLSDSILETVRKHLRSTDEAFISDAGDIVAILPSTELNGADMVLKKIISQMRILLSAQDPEATEDYYGVTVVFPHDGGTFNDLMHTAVSRIEGKRKLEKVATSLHKQMAHAHYVYRRNQWIW